MTGTVVITMAGGGRRFREAGYDLPKFRVAVQGRTLFDWSLTSLDGFTRAGWRFVFVAQAADAVSAFVAERCPALGIDDYGLVELPGITDGQATSVLAAGPAVPRPDRPLVIYNIDTYVQPDALPPAAIRGDGWIPCFPGQGDGWSFARTEGADLRVVEVREKQRISPHCTIGLYYFRSLDSYRTAYDRYYADPAHLEKGERYVAPLYNQLIRDGAAVHVHPIPAAAVHPLGTPAEVAAFAVAYSRTGPATPLP